MTQNSSTRAEIVAIGTEILLGDLIDTNSAYLAEQLKGIGVNLHLKTVVGDNLERITTAIGDAHERAQVVITSGGLGPTVDDLTREAVAAVAGVDLVYSQELMDQIENIFSSRGFQMSPNNRKQAYIPKGAIPIENPVGTAPCFIVEDQKGSIIVLPGVPRELKYLMETRVLPYLRKKFELGERIRVRVLKTCALGESHVDHLIHDLFQESRNPSIAVLAHPGQVDIRLTAKGTSDDEVEAMLDKLEERVNERLGAAVYGYGEDTVEEVVGRLLLETGRTLAVFETNTGGALATRMTSVRGSESFFRGGWVASSREFLGALLPPKGGVAALNVTAGDLAHRVRELADADMGLAVVGPILGGGDLEISPPQPTYIVLNKEDGSADKVEYSRRFGGSGRFLQDRVSITALDVLRRHLLGVEPLPT